jgi:hypothetical protein
MEHQAQLEWESRFGRFAGVAAFGAIVFQIASFAIQAPALKDQPGRDDPDRHSQTLISFHDHAGAVLASQVVQAVGSFLVAAVLLYLFQATRYRRRELPGFLRWLLLIGPVLLLVGAVLNGTDLKKISDRYIDRGGETALKGPPTAAERATAKQRCTKERGDTPARRRAFEQRYPKGLDQCVTRRSKTIHVEREDKRAKDLIENDRNLLGGGLGFAGTISIALAFVLISLNAMRAGLLSRFVGILGVLVGALMVLPLLPGGSSVIEVFWLGAVGMLALNRWPGGRGPAWETGGTDPWPSAAERRGLLPPPADEANAPEVEPEPEPEEQAERQHPRSKKRKRKKRR